MVRSHLGSPINPMTYEILCGQPATSCAPGVRVGYRPRAPQRLVGRAWRDGAGFAGQPQPERDCRCTGFYEDVVSSLVETKETVTSERPCCWICGASADSGEHKAKRSDLQMVFEVGNVVERLPRSVGRVRERSHRTFHKLQPNRSASL